MKWWHNLVHKFTIVPRLNRLKVLLPEAAIFPVGSRYVCDPPPMVTDIDFLIYYKGELSSVHAKLIAAGYKETVTREYFGNTGTIEDGDFTAWRRGVLNLIVTSSYKYALTFHTATHICKTRNVLSKYDRIIIHEWVRGRTEVALGLHDWNYKDLEPFFEAVNGPHGHAIHMAYRAQHDLTGITP